MLIVALLIHRHQRREHFDNNAEEALRTLDMLLIGCDNVSLQHNLSIICQGCAKLLCHRPHGARDADIAVLHCNACPDIRHTMKQSTAVDVHSIEVATCYTSSFLKS